ncbi:hypothetical protein [Thalassococcus sp. S3]|uniref:hypothetical protein n=1 Tax=Thalassococcus sp. S3 TaxID=2017482 RepID=UPI00102420BE|nr:hypothetical protein [Thalassococcus sp. S3]QBF32133.1 hypothetical protein CFI11_13020 [Thalassococcus sp. S3]
MGPLWQRTRDVHHRAEQHPLAKAMMDGTISPQHWADWLNAQLTLQRVLDPYLPPAVQRSAALAGDLLSMLPIVARPNKAAQDHAERLTDIQSVFGAAYILIGSYKRGGRVIEKAMQAKGLDLPSSHVRFEDNADAERFVTRLRERRDLGDAAYRTFAAIIDIMDEIHGEEAG